MDAFSVLNDVIDDYASFVHGFLHIKDAPCPDIAEPRALRS
jgi:hypothetical protein